MGCMGKLEWNCLAQPGPESLREFAAMLLSWTRTSLVFTFSPGLDNMALIGWNPQAVGKVCVLGLSSHPALGLA